MPDLLRREFLIKVLMTIGADKLIRLSGLAANEVLNMSLGLTAISESAIEAVYSALGAD